MVFDLETTGLAPDQNDIIEIGALRIENGRITERFQQLLSPTHPIPQFISHMTGITPAMVQDQPGMRAVWPRFEAFISGAVLVAHNVTYDVGMLHQALKRYDLHMNEYPVVDTQDLVTLLRPTLTSLRLEDVARDMDVLLPDAHRAMADAEATAEIFLRLLHDIETLPLAQLEACDQLLGKSTWPLRDFFKAALDRRGVARSIKTALKEKARWTDLVKTEIEVRQVEEGRTGNEDEDELGKGVEALLGEGGRLSQLIPGFEVRTSQLQMAEAVAKALAQDQHALIEAGTGTGKSLAYLLPAALFSLQQGEQVVISTYTKTLQHQLLYKDVPVLKKLLGRDLVVTVIKGRENYICLRKWEEHYRDALKNQGNPLIMAAWISWLAQTESGDLSELHGSVASPLVERVRSQTSTCIREQCAHFQRCFAFKVRKQARQADLVITNHAQLLADLQGDHFILKPYERLIIDEAHHLEAATTDAMSARVALGTWWNELRQLWHDKNPDQGLLMRLKSKLKQHDLNKTPLAEALQMVFNGWPAMTESIEALQTAGMGAARQARVAQAAEEAGLWHVTPQWRESPLWTPLGTALEICTQAASAMSAALAKLLATLGEYEQHADLRALRGDLGGPVEALRRMEQALGLFASADPAYVYSVEYLPARRPPLLAFIAAPLSVTAYLNEKLFAQKRTVILTSATLTVNDSFEFIRQRVGLLGDVEQRLNMLKLPSEFDYRQQALLAIPSDVPSRELEGRGYARLLARWLLPVLEATQGRALVLFTAYALLEQVAQCLRDPARDAGLTVLSQSQYFDSRRSLYERFKSGGGPMVLLATSSFWEGIDIPGEALSLVVIVKLPFDVPTDPLVAARSQAVEAEGLSGFMHYQMPLAVLRFKQGVGRLIRSKSDRGAVLVLDERLTTKGYGKYFLKTVEDYRHLRGSRAELIEEIKTWLGVAAPALDRL